MRIRSLAILAFTLLGIMTTASAAPALQIIPITWNVIGLDSNNVNVGPNKYPVGARVCNVGDATATDVTASLVLDGVTNPFISINGRTTLSVPSLSAGPTQTSTAQYTQAALPANCTDFYFLVEIARNSGAYSSRVSNTATPTQRKTQQYFITASATGVTAVTTPRPRELYVEKILSQARNKITLVNNAALNGPTAVMVGGTYEYTLQATTAPGGYEQLEVFPVFPNVIFQVMSVKTTYTTPAGTTNTTVYADACGWENNPASSNYHNNGTCIGPAGYVGGKAGDVINTTIKVKILSAGTATVQSMINDFSGSSYHYNADYDAVINAFSITAYDPPDLTLTKTHTGSFPFGGNGSFTLTATNSGAFATSGAVTVTDTLPAGLTPATVSGSGWTCGASGQTVTCTRGDALPAGASYPPILLGVSVAQNAPASVTNTAQVSGGGETNTANNTASDTVTLVEATAAADVSVTKTGPALVNTGASLAYDLTVRNAGPNAATGAVVTDPAVAWFTSTGVTCTAVTGGAVCPASPTVTQLHTGLTLSTLPSGGSVTLRVTGTAGTTGPIQNTVTVAPPTGTNDPSPGNNTATATTKIQNLTYTKTVENVTAGGGSGQRGTGTPGDTLEYCLKVSNVGSSNVTSLVFRDPVPGGTAAQLDGYGSGLGVRLDSGGTVTALTSAADSDAGSLTSTAFRVTLASLSAGTTASSCFRVTVR